MVATTTKTKKETYFEAVGRRKSAVARVRLFEKTKGGNIDVNEKDVVIHFPTAELQEIIKSPLKKVGMEKSFYISVKVNGGGVRSQADAIKLGISRALLKVDAELRAVLKPEKFLTRDARVKERRKFGLKKARKAPQWSKR